MFDRKVKGFGISILKNGWKTTSSWELMVFKKKQRKTIKISVEVTTKYLEILQNSKVKCGNCWQIVQSSWNYVLQIFVSACVWNNWHFVRIKITTEIWPSQHQVISHNYWTFLCWRCSRLNPFFLEISWSSLFCHRIFLNAFHPKTEEDISFQTSLYLLPQDKFLRFSLYSWFLRVWVAFQDWPCSPICLANSASQTLEQCFPKEPLWWWKSSTSTLSNIPATGQMGLLST